MNKKWFSHISFCSVYWLIYLLTQFSIFYANKNDLLNNKRLWFHRLHSQREPGNQRISCFYFANQKHSGILLFFVVIIILFTLPGCLSNTPKKNPSVKRIFLNIDGEPVVPREANKISIPIFKNNTKIHYLAEKLTARLKEEINMDGRLAVVNNNARLLLNGILIQYQLQPIIFDNFGEPVQKRLRILASIQLFDLKKKKEIFFERSIQSFEEFSEIVPPIKTELQTREKILRILAKRIAKKVIKGWYTGLMTPVEKGK